MHNVALTKINWKSVITTTIALSELARKIYDTLKKHAKSSKSQKKDKEISITEFSNKIQRLENNELEHAELISKMADQIEVLSKSFRVVGARLNFTLFISICAAILVLFTIIWIVLF